MESFASKVKNTKIPSGNIGVFFLGQAGFVIKTPKDKLIAVDPYLSDCCNRYFGFKRLMPYILEANELEFDYVVASHAHYDHFDPDSIPALLSNGKTEFVGAMDTAEECDKLGIKERTHFLSVGDEIQLGDIKLTAVRCDHGADTPHALGLLFELDGKRIYMMGDTAYRPEWLCNERLCGTDLLILPINGAFGNLDSTTASKVAGALKPKLTVPCHYWNFAEHFGNPYEFMTNMKNDNPSLPFMLMRQGESLTV